MFSVPWPRSLNFHTTIEKSVTKERASVKMSFYKIKFRSFKTNMEVYKLSQMSYLSCKNIKRKGKIKNLNTAEVFSSCGCFLRHFINKNTNCYPVPFDIAIFHAFFNSRNFNQSAVFHALVKNSGRYYGVP